MPPPPPSSSKALAAILPLIASGQAYEAHQKARTFASRYSKSGAYDVAIDVLAQSATELFKAGQLGSGTDLGCFLLEVYELKGAEVNDESRARLTQLISLAGSEGQWRKTLMDRSMSWSAKHSPYRTGDPTLHAFLGDLFFKESDYPAAEIHFLAAGTRDAAKALANVLFAWSRNGADPGTYASKGVIPYLLAGNILAARIFLASFLTLLVAARPDILARQNAIPLPASGESAADEVYLTTDLTLNFLQLAIRTCQRAKNAQPQGKQAQEMWVRLCGSYQSRRGLVAQGVYREALSEIGTLFFDLPAPRAAAGNPLQDMMASFLGGPPGGGSQAPPKRTLPIPAQAITLD
ncbi:hypothetical protein M408DRAFT_64328 [Serendipita vermifera MAFF 305830]|uniref:Cytoplasmic protein n=1 Tax=Serendipita vermifera MAFF 305830 TaxID=933852 RepID=A0A0C3BHN1_SERVB|nr:hypothetical protein M408DRAFT_64328 [Serendipita vermifera MAFF 305830]